MIYQPFIGEIKGVQIVREDIYKVIQKLCHALEEEHNFLASRSFIELHIIAIEEAEKRGINPYRFEEEILDVIYSLDSIENYKLIHDGEEYPYHFYNKAIESAIKTTLEEN